MSDIITLPPLPKPHMHNFEGWPTLYSADDLRARDLEIVRIVLEGAAKVAELSHPDDWAFIGATLRNLEIKHHE
jgi:hypothetical protein